jgi:hypothetical protein
MGGMCEDPFTGVVRFVRSFCNEGVVQLSSCLLATIHFILPRAAESGSQARRGFANPPRAYSPTLLGWEGEVEPHALWEGALGGGGLDHDCKLGRPQNQLT